MPNEFPESDWKILSRLKPLLLDRLCQRILMTSEDIIVRAKEGGYHSAYLELYKRIHASDEKVANCFNDWRRSSALEILINWRSENLLTEEEFAAFSSGTRTIVTGFLKKG
jgi:hypothetical protein